MTNVQFWLLLTDRLATASDEASRTSELGLVNNFIRAETPSKIIYLYNR